MTEKEWLQATDPQPMLEFLRGKASDRKLRLFACACSRSVWHLMPDSRSCRAIEIVEGYCDGLYSAEEMSHAGELAEDASNDAYKRGDGVGCNAAAAALLSAQGSTRSGELYTPHLLSVIANVVEVLDEADHADKLAVFKHLSTRLRCIVGPLPFRPVSLDSAWLTWHDGMIPRLAQAIYDERAFDRLPILADALEEAGCSDQDILGHCRSGGEHVRGCWVVDLVLGKS